MLRCGASKRKAAQASASSLVKEPGIDDIKDKEDRCAAIKRGFGVLEHMRYTMKDVMARTNIQLQVRSRA